MKLKRFTLSAWSVFALYNLSADSGFEPYQKSWIFKKGSAEGTIEYRERGGLSKYEIDELWKRAKKQKKLLKNIEASQYKDELLAEVKIARVELEILIKHLISKPHGKYLAELDSLSAEEQKFIKGSQGSIYNMMRLLGYKSYVSDDKKGYLKNVDYLIKEIKDYNNLCESGKRFDKVKGLSLYIYDNGIVDKKTFAEVHKKYLDKKASFDSVFSKYPNLKSLLKFEELNSHFKGDRTINNYVQFISHGTYDPISKADLASINKHLNDLTKIVNDSIALDPKISLYHEKKIKALNSSYIVKLKEEIAFIKKDLVRQEEERLRKIAEEKELARLAAIRAKKKQAEVDEMLKVNKFNETL